MRVGGLDGCRGGWALAVLDDAGGLELHFVESFPSARDLADAGELQLLGIDMPIGLPERGRRACDVAARQRLGRRASSVFAAPSRAILTCPSHRAANAASRAVDGRGLSAQTYGLFTKLREVDAAMTPTAQARVREVHPELAFAAMGGGAPAAHSKRSREGAAERHGLLRAHLPRARVDQLVERRPAGVASDDALDAIAVAWSTRRLATGHGEVLTDGACDARGLLMEICY